jgi:signal transduction histidine kinase
LPTAEKAQIWIVRTMDVLFPWKDYSDATRSLGAEDIIYPYVDRLIRQAETMLDLDPSFSEAGTFQILTKNIAQFLEAEIASIWLFQKDWHYISSFVRQDGLFNDSKVVELFDPEIFDEAFRNGRSRMVSDIWQDENWQNKEPFRKFGVNSALLVPIPSPKNSSGDSDPGGLLQVFYKEREKVFSPLEVDAAQLFSRRVSYVLARKQIWDLQMHSSIKNRISEHIFKCLIKGEGIFMRDLFNAVIPELSGIMNVQRCALFSVNRQQGEAVLEAGYPEKMHGIGKTRSLREPYIEKIIDSKGPFGQFEYESIDPHYILITDPQRSQLIPGDIKYFLETQDINSVLYLPLKGEEVNYFLSFDAQGRHERFSEEDIDILLFLGRELMKGLRMERLYDLLHDSKNIAISQAYFAKRIQNILQKERCPENERLDKAVEIILEGSIRLQELFQTLFGEGNEVVVDVTALARRRFIFYQAAMREREKDKILFIQKEMTAPFHVRCVPFHLERIIDNLLSNAVLAIPDEGGELSLRAGQEGTWGIMEIANTARVSREAMEEHLREAKDGKGKGRGLHICNQLIRNMGGEIEVEVKDDLVIFQVKLPVIKS